MKICVPVILSAIICLSCNNVGNIPEEENNSRPEFSFAFLTDIHIQPERGAIEGFQMAIDCVNVLNPDFVITGGDLIMDAMGVSHGRADSLYTLYIEMSKKFNMPVYNCMGNHEFYGIREESGADPAHPDYGERMFENRIGKRYYSFVHEGWHFVILEGIEAWKGAGGTYKGEVDSAQVEWIREKARSIDPSAPVVLVTHIPLVSIMPQLRHGPLYNKNYSTLVTNNRDVLMPFINHNLKLVLQGHLHIVEELTAGQKATFLTGGAVCGKWWNTPEHTDTQEGFVFVRVKGDQFDWEYIDYGWETLAE